MDAESLQAATSSIPLFEPGPLVAGSLAVLHDPEVQCKEGMFSRFPDPSQFVEYNHAVSCGLSSRA